MSDGVIYVATGADYVDLACQSLASLRQSNPGLAADIFTDNPARAGVGSFDRVHTVPKVHPRVRLDCLPLSRFDRTLFLDADTLVVGDLGDLFAVADRFDLAMAHDVRRASDLIREGLEEVTPYAFPQLNAGVILYRRGDATSAFFAEWSRRYAASGVARDQVILKDLLWSSAIRFYVLPPEFNLRRLPMIDAWEPLDAHVTIIHSHRLMDHMTGRGPRLSTPGDLIAAERSALQSEWRDVGADAPADRLAWFTRAGR